MTQLSDYSPTQLMQLVERHPSPKTLITNDYKPGYYHITVYMKYPHNLDCAFFSEIRGTTQHGVIDDFGNLIRVKI